MADSSETFVVFVGDGLSRCVPAGDPAASTFLAEGMALVWEGAPSRLEGWTRAAVEFGCIPDDYDDAMLPCLLSDPKPLYRSVSLRELDHILKTGSVRGGGNRFNEFERRPWVFFSPSPSERCLSQGEDVTRAAAQAVIEEHGEAAFAGQDGRRRFKELYEEQRSKLVEQNERMPFSSAVIRTKPLALGYHYSLEHGRTGMGGEDEYGLFPGQVKLHDIDCVMWVKDGSIVGTCPPDEAADVLGQAYEAAAKSCPRP